MYAVSSNFITALRQPSMRMAVSVVASDGTVISIQNGSVTMDSRRSIGRTAELEIVPNSNMSLVQLYDLVMRPDLEITIKRGLVLADGTTEYVPLGVFSTDNATYSKRVAGVLSWSGSDRSKKISRAKFVDPYQITTGTSLASAATTLLQSRFANVTTNFSNVLENVTANVVFDAGDNSDPWASIQDLFVNYGYELRFNGDGTAVAVAVPDPSAVTPIFDFGSGATNLVLDAEMSGTFEKTYNGVIVTGEGSNLTLPIRAEVWDTDPSSPTYYLGGFGKVPLFFTSSLITSTALANAVAIVLLSKLKGKTEKIAWPAVVNPALEPLDVVQITVGGSTYKIVLDQIFIPLKAQEVMTANARQTSS